MFFFRGKSRDSGQGPRGNRQERQLARAQMPGEQRRRRSREHGRVLVSRQEVKILYDT